jgi:hypothetical protein
MGLWVDDKSSHNTTPTHHHSKPTQALALAADAPLDPEAQQSVIKALYWRARALENESFYDVALADAKVKIKIKWRCLYMFVVCVRMGGCVNRCVIHVSRIGCVCMFRWVCLNRRVSHP